jgi:cell division protein FtsB
MSKKTLELSEARDKILKKIKALEKKQVSLEASLAELASEIKTLKIEKGLIEEQIQSS